MTILPRPFLETREKCLIHTPKSSISTVGKSQGGEHLRASLFPASMQKATWESILTPQWESHWNVSGLGQSLHSEF